MEKKDWLALGLICFFAGWVLRPIMGHMGSQMVNNYDGQLIAWIEATVAQKILDGQWQTFFEAPIYASFPYALTFSELFLPTVIMILPVWLLTQNPIIILNLSTYLALAMTLAAMYWLILITAHNRWSALILAIIFGTSGLYFIYYGHIHNFNLAGILVGLGALVKLAHTGKRKWVLIWGTALLLQTLNSFLTGMMLVTGSLVLWWRWPNLRLKIKENINFFGKTALLAGLVLAPVVYAYFKAERYYHSARPIQDVMHFSMGLDELWRSLWSPWLWLAFLLGVIGFLFRRQHLKKEPMIGAWLAVALTGLIMALGPALKWNGQSVKIPYHIPLPYLVFYYLVPGFQAVRAVARWSSLMAIGMTVLAGLGLQQLPRRWRGLAWLILGVGVVWQMVTPGFRTFPATVTSDTPPVYQWLQQAPGKTMIELPIFRWGYDEFARNETTRMLYQLKHQKLLVNGYSGFSPKKWEEMVAKIHLEFPSPELIGQLKQMKVDYLVIHTQEYTRWRGSQETEKEY